jgi:aryl-alcohol dehydrogenase (NADP+)
MEALHDVVKAGKARYIGASSMHAWEFGKALAVAERNGWTRFVSMQNLVNLMYREEEREMLPLCADQGIGVIPWSPQARGRLTRDWDYKSIRTARLFNAMEWLGLQAGYRYRRERRGSGPGRGCWSCLT